MTRRSKYGRAFSVVLDEYLDARDAVQVAHGPNYETFVELTKELNSFFDTENDDSK